MLSTINKTKPWGTLSIFLSIRKWWWDLRHSSDKKVLLINSVPYTASGVRVGQFRTELDPDPQIDSGERFPPGDVAPRFGRRNLISSKSEIISSKWIFLKKKKPYKPNPKP
jgi:hypothetical protein